MKKHVVRAIALLFVVVSLSSCENMFGIFGPRFQTFRVTYDANGADTGTAPSSRVKAEGEALTVASNLGGLSRTNYSFAGWNTAADGSGTAYAEGSLYETDADVTLYAVWAPVSVRLLAPSGAANDFFGFSVSVSGDYAVVGAYGQDNGGTNSGAAYVFRRTATNTWDAGTLVTASDGAAGDEFGRSVAIDGEYMIVGASADDDNGSNSGSAYIFRRTGIDTWDAGTKIVAPDAAAGDRFGNSVAIHGDYVVVGALFDDTGVTDSGSAYVFRRTGINTWDSGIRIVPDDVAASDFVGEAVSIHGDYVVVSSSWDDDAGTSSGSAYVFRRTGTNTWDAGTKIVASDAAAGDRFGRGVSIYGDYVIVGAFRDADLGVDSGSAYVFRRTGLNTWDAGTKLLEPSGGEGNAFGFSVALSGSRAIVGRNPATFATDAGSAYVFTRTGDTSWTTGTRITALDGSAGDSFAFSVALDGQYAFVGASMDDDNGVDSGSAYSWWLGP